MFGAALFLAAGVVGFAAGRGGIAFLPLGGYALFLLLSWAQGAARKDAGKGHAGGTFAFEMLLLVKTAPLLCLFLLPGAFGNVHSERATDVAHSFLLFFCVLFLFANAVTEHAALRRALARGDALAAVLPRPLALTLRPVSPFTFAAFFAALAVHALGAGFIGPLPLLAACALALPLGAAADAFLYAAPSRSGTALFAAFSLARDFLPDAVGKSSGVRIRERRSFFRFMVFTTHHCRRLFQKVIRDESILTLFNHFVTSCRLNPRFRDIFLFLYRFAFSPLINSESLSGSRSFCARISCAFYCADLTPSDLKAQSLRFRS